MNRGVRRIVVPSIWPLNLVHTRRGYHGMSSPMWCTYTVKPMSHVKMAHGISATFTNVHAAPSAPPCWNQPSAAIPTPMTTSATMTCALSRRMRAAHFCGGVKRIILFHHTWRP